MSFQTLLIPNYRSSVHKDFDIAYHFYVLLILISGPDNSGDVDNDNHDLCDVKCGVLKEVHIGKDEVPVNSVRHNDPPASERGHVSTNTLNMSAVCQGTNLRANQEEYNIYIPPIYLYHTHMNLILSKYTIQIARFSH